MYIVLLIKWRFIKLNPGIQKESNTSYYVNYTKEH